jgi:glycosyltransferase involved in cell wall biosynthesis
VNILHLAGYLQGGAGLVIAELAAAQQAAGHQTVVVTSDTAEPDHVNYPAHLDTLARAGVTVHTVDSLHKRDERLARRVVRFVEEAYGGGGHFDLIHAHAAQPSVIGLMLAARARSHTPVVQTVHGWGHTRAQAAADVAALKQVERVVVPAQPLASLLERQGLDRARMDVIPHGVAQRTLRHDDAELDEIRAWRRAGGTVLCCIGTINEARNQHALVDALAHLDIDDRQRILCAFVGEGDTAALEQQAARRGVRPLIRFYGYRFEARRFAAASDFLILPSLSGGQPISILEAFCDGVPVIASALPEIAEIVRRGETGFLFDPKQPRELAAAIHGAMHLSAGARGTLRACMRDVYEREFTDTLMVDRYMRLYRHLREETGSLPAPARLLPAPLLAAPPTP